MRIPALLMLLAVFLASPVSASEPTPVRIIVDEEPSGPPVALTGDGDVTVNLFNERNRAGRIIVLTHAGDILLSPDAQTIVGKDGRMYTLDVRNRYMDFVDRNTDKKTTRCIGSDVNAAVDDVRIFERPLPFCIEKPVFAVRDGKVFGMFKKEGDSEISGVKFLSPDGSVTHVDNVPLGGEIAASDSGYYMTSVSFSSDELEVYAFDRDFSLIKVYRLGRRVTAPHITVDPSGVPHLIYYNARRQTLMYARLEGEAFRSYEIEAPDAGFENSIDSDAHDVLIASYFMRNPYNKGILLYRIPVDAPDVRAGLARCVFLRRRDENIGWSPSISTNGAEVALAAYNRTRKQTEIFRFVKDYISSANDLKPDWFEPWMEKQKKLNLYAEFGLEYVQWDSAVNTHFSDLTGATPPPGRFRVNPMVLKGIGFGGEYDDISFGFEYAKNALLENEDINTSEGERQIAESLMGNLSFGDVFGYDTALEIHAKQGRLVGSYVNSGVAYDFATSYTDVDADIFDKEGYFFFGLGYRRYRTPQPVVVSQSGAITESYVTNADFAIFSLQAGYSNLNYLRQYENRYNGPYLDAKASVGLAAISLERQPSAPAETPEAYVYGLSAQAGYLYFKRMQSLRYASFFIKAGVEFDCTYISARPKDAGGSATPTASINIERLDCLYGLYAGGGITF